jgi:hypothetical protein
MVKKLELLLIKKCKQHHQLEKYYITHNDI